MASRPTYRFTYFPHQGRGEVARIIMAYAGFEFEDIRIDHEEFTRIKADLPHGHLPILEVNGEVICQSHAINVYLAKQAGLMGNSDWDAAKINMFIGCMDDFVGPLEKLIHEKSKEKKIILREQLLANLPAETKKIEKLLPSQYCVADQLTLADIYTAYTLDFPSRRRFDFQYNWDEFPKLKAMRDNVFSHPNIAAWIAKRPNTTPNLPLRRHDAS